jgi:YafQ family addiction module toxin component
MRKFEVSNKLKKDLQKLSKKNKTRYESTIKKFKEIIACQNINHYKNLRKPLQHLKRVHIDNSFVLTFEFIKRENTIRFIELEHHDKIYNK